MSGSPMLDLLAGERVFSISRTTDGGFAFTEKCDEYFGVKLTREQLLALAHELIALADQPVNVVQFDGGARVMEEGESYTPHPVTGIIISYAQPGFQATWCRVERGNLVEYAYYPEEVSR